jgi:D-alanine-D-alanine ligase
MKNNMHKFGKVAVVMGGFSAEREISLLSGVAIYNSLKAAGVDAHEVIVERNIIAPIVAGNFDRVFIALHGRGGEDGMIQGALEAVNIPYTGSRIGGSALAIDKLRSKKIWNAARLQTPDSMSYCSEEKMDLERARRIIARLGPAVFVKPALEGSSVGMAKASTAQQLVAAVESACVFGSMVLIEHCIVGEEYTVAILGEDVLPSIKLETPREFYDYKAKYHSQNTVYSCPSGLSNEDEAELSKVSLKAFKELGCFGWGRVDVMRGRSGRWNLLEVNTVPGMTEKSLVPMAAKQAGLSFEDIVIKVLETSLSDEQKNNG